LCTLVNMALDNDDYFLYETESSCECGTIKLDLMKSMVSSFANIFLFNYTKVVNDTINVSGGKKRKLNCARKLKTLT